MCQYMLCIYITREVGAGSDVSTALTGKWRLYQHACSERERKSGDLTAAFEGWNKTISVSVYPSHLLYVVSIYILTIT